MDVPSEEEQFLVTVVPPVVGGEHVVVLPHVRPVAEVCGVDVATVLQARCLHEGGVHIHVHLVVEDEQAGLRVIRTVQAFDNLPVLVAHGRAVLEDGDGVLGVVVQVAGAEGVFVLVFQLYESAAELREVVVHHVLQRAGTQPGAVLDDLDMADGVDDVRRHVPQGGIAQEVGVVVQETGGTCDFAETLPVLFNELGRPGTHQGYQRVFPVLGGNGCGCCPEGQRRQDAVCENPPHAPSRTWWPRYSG